MLGIINVKEIELMNWKKNFNPKFYDCKCTYCSLKKK